MIATTTTGKFKPTHVVPQTTIRIRTVDDQEHLFSMHALTEEGPNLTIATKIEKLLSRRSFAVEVDNQLLIIPLNQIRTIEVGPLQQHLPESLVPRVERII